MLISVVVINNDLVLDLMIIVDFLLIIDCVNSESNDRAKIRDKGGKIKKSYREKIKM